MLGFNYREGSWNFAAEVLIFEMFIAAGTRNFEKSPRQTS
jgi:hypothetical protein